MFNILPLIIILFCLAVIIFVVVKKFPQIANLDVDNLLEEKESRKKNAMIDKRVDDQSRKLKEVWARRLAPIVKIWGRLQLSFRIYFGNIERLWHHEESVKIKAKVKEMTPEEKEKRIKAIIQEAETNLQAGNLDKAEELFISAIKINVKSVPAYRGLGETYIAKKTLDEARQTFKFVLQLNKEDDTAMVKLAEIAEMQGNWQEAIQYYEKAMIKNDSLSPRFYHLAELLLKIKQPEIAREAIVQAVELEPKNPKYLDLLLEIAIICGDKKLSQEGLNELRLVNPENQKLDEFRMRIAQMQ
ncbi:tetratricopeptide repeat protein [Patescibacteria group bacterium]|nr:tetratricopeptide repeat protein [Patescibacteria group bacterium]MBU1613072.1 tetratricopeptide repeat protein [Patescibacteria group bacterium]